jgi:hypothetical protein
MVLSDTLSRLLGVTLAAAGGLAPLSASFIDEFNSTTLDPAWTVIPYSGSIPRAHGNTGPANSFSLTATPGRLRYTLNPMTHGDGFINGYQTTTGVHSCCTHDAGLEISRPLSGDHWLLEFKADYFMPFSNGRALNLDVYFGSGGTGTYLARFGRGRDTGTNDFRTTLDQLSGPFPSLTPLGYRLEQTSGDINTVIYQLIRNGGNLSARWSEDNGATWIEGYSVDLSGALGSLEQRVSFSGLSWFNPAGSYADYDYVSFNDVPEPATGLMVLAGLFGAAAWRRRRGC